ncbi:2-oxoisovalerate dehydrogenase subunit alpha, mitochondrial isoform X1 [Vespa velutina]|uniref:2-oxoisovalerate dehydrogenase subunit alpha, mitochondrial isoform X1 n=1 Tax=Vespa velutina TaxID=202808 RepID=UPI001FB1B10C|nr:2-oxoisovalerate dehydrogenase subunit alpha, mitochondrial isoform X1 [Vespa velutina]
MVIYNLFKSISRLSSVRWQISIRHYCYATNVTEPQYVGIKNNFTNHLKFINAENYESIPIYRILDPAGQTHFLEENKVFLLKLDDKTKIKIYRDMMTLTIMDKIMYESQRQGRISFYMTNTGEEAVQIGSASALMLEDAIYAQYREAGVLLWRGFHISKFMNQCYGNVEDEGKGRQMPCHYGSKDLNFITISSPLTTQLPQAVGAAYAYKREKRQACVMCYFGEGAASEGDAHAAFNFAATLSCPIIFLCRNNGYAISTPAHEQFKGDGIAAKGPSYGINTIRVDGNDVLAVHYATKAARQFCISEGKPVLIEAMTYRTGPHSTSDDSTVYRTSKEIALWNDVAPIRRFRQYIQSLGIWSKEQEDNLKIIIKKEILDAFIEAEKKPKPHWKEMFTDTYFKMPDHIRDQMYSMEEHLATYYEHYPLKTFQS